MDDRNPHSPLNQAHSFARGAEIHEKLAKFDEACKCHQKAVELLQKSAEIATFPSTKESIQLQIIFHQRQEQIILLKKLHFEIQQNIFAQKQKLLKMERENQLDSKIKDDNLQWAIYKNIEAADSLIHTLADRELNSVEDETDSNQGTAYNSGIKHPKNDSTVIEELHTLNNKLRELISQLLGQLEETQKEAASLRLKVKYYESLYEKKNSNAVGEENLIDFNSMSSSGESIGIMP